MSSINRILETYERSLIIPSVKPSPQFYVVPVGLVGSGKTSVLEPLSEKLHLLRISGDEIRKIIMENGGSLEDTWEIGNRLVLKYADKGYSIAHDTDGATLKTQESIRNQAEKYGIKVIWIHINPPEAYIIHKLQNFKHSWLFKNSEEAIAAYYSRKHLHSDLHFDFAYEFDTSAPNLDQQIDQAILAIEKRLQLN